jgi:hypothetical protein
MPNCLDLGFLFLLLNLPLPVQISLNNIWIRFPQVQAERFIKFVEATNVVHVKGLGTYSKTYRWKSQNQRQIRMTFEIYNAYWILAIGLHREEACLRWTGVPEQQIGGFVECMFSSIYFPRNVAIAGLDKDAYYGGENITEGQFKHIFRALTEN